MSKPANDTALLIFTRTAAAEAANKNLAPQKSAKSNTNIAKRLIQRTIQTAAESGLPCIVFTEAEQKGNSFGEKLSNAVQYVLEKGFQKLIVIGNDCLQLNKAHIQEACILLQTNDTILAPTTKGGVYLLGITKNSFDKESFQNISWQSASVYIELLYTASLKNLSVSSLQVFDDVSGFSDLKKQITLLFFADVFRKYIISLVASFQHFFYNNPFFFFPEKQFSLSGLRAPPLY